MTLDPIWLASRLRDARKATGYTPKVVAKELGISGAEFKELEAGQRSVSTLEITRLAQLYGQSVKTLLDYAQPCDESNALVALYRAAGDSGASGPWRKDAAQRFAVCRIGCELKKLLGLAIAGQYPEYEWSTPSKHTDAVKQGTDAAKKERKRLGLGSQPITNMAFLINKQGIWASDAKLPNGMSGRLFHDRDFGTVILVNCKSPVRCKRFSYAREYAHAILESHTPVVRACEAERNTLLNMRADAFASEFLLPEDGIRTFFTSSGEMGPAALNHRVRENDIKDLGDARAIEQEPLRSLRLTFEDVARLAHYYGVAFDTAVDRLKTTSVIDELDSQTLLTQEPLATRYITILHNEDPHSAGKRDTALNAEVIHFAIDAYRAELISSGMLRDVGGLVGMPGNELVGFAEAALE